MLREMRNLPGTNYQIEKCSDGHISSHGSLYTLQYFKLHDTSYTPSVGQVSTLVLFGYYVYRSKVLESFALQCAFLFCKRLLHPARLYSAATCPKYIENTHLPIQAQYANPSQIWLEPNKTRIGEITAIARERASRHSIHVIIDHGPITFYTIRANGMATRHRMLWRFGETDQARNVALEMVCLVKASVKAG
jgi:hypothetical protein